MPKNLKCYAITTLAELKLLWIEHFPSGVRAGMRVLRIGNVMYGIDQRGRFFTDSWNRGRLGNREPSRALCSALVRLRVASAALLAEFKADRKRRDTKAAASSALFYHVKELEALGVKLTKAQLRRLKRVEKTGVV